MVKPPQPGFSDNFIYASECPGPHLPCPSLGRALSRFTVAHCVMLWLSVLKENGSCSDGSNQIRFARHPRLHTHFGFGFTALSSSMEADGYRFVICTCHTEVSNMKCTVYSTEMWRRVLLQEQPGSRRKFLSSFLPFSFLSLPSPSSFPPSPLLPFNFLVVVSFFMYPWMLWNSVDKPGWS